MANKKQNKYKVRLGVSYEKEIYVEADNAYDALHIIKKILLKSNLFKFYPNEIYSMMMDANNEKGDYCDFNADELQDGRYDVDMTINGVSFGGECDLTDNFIDVLNPDSVENVCNHNCNDCPNIKQCSL